MAKKIAKKSVKRERFYGMVKIKKGAKAVWVSAENKNGWSLGYAVSKRTIWLRNVRFQTKEEVELAISNAKLVFIEKKG